MSLYTSERERRFWLWTLVMLVAIYASLGPVGSLVAYLRERNMLRLSMAMVLFLLVGSIAWWWLKRRPGLGEIMVALGVSAVYLIAWVRIPIPEERTHLIEYGLVAVLIYLALSERQRNGRQLPPPAALALVTTALLGLLDEGIQALLPNRVFDIWDVGFNALAGLMAIGAILAIGWARRLRK